MTQTAGVITLYFITFPLCSDGSGLTAIAHNSSFRFFTWWPHLAINNGINLHFNPSYAPTRNAEEYKKFIAHTEGKSAAGSRGLGKRLGQGPILRGKMDEYSLVKSATSAPGRRPLFVRNTLLARRSLVGRRLSFHFKFNRMVWEVDGSMSTAAHWKWRHHCFSWRKSARLVWNFCSVCKKISVSNVIFRFFILHFIFLQLRCALNSFIFCCDNSLIKNL